MEEAAIQEERYKKLLEAAGFQPEDLEAFTAEELAAMYEDYAGEEAAIAEQRNQADMIRQATTQNLGGTQAGNVFVADNPLETVAQIGGAFMARRDEDEATRRAEEMSQRRAMGNEASARLGAMGRQRAFGSSPMAAGIRQETEEEKRRRQLEAMGY
jgi:hypothetical protein